MCQRWTSRTNTEKKSWRSLSCAIQYCTYFGLAFPTRASCASIFPSHISRVNCIKLPYVTGWIASSSHHRVLFTNTLHRNARNLGHPYKAPFYVGPMWKYVLCGSPMPFLFCLLVFDWTAVWRILIPSNHIYIYWYSVAPKYFRKRDNDPLKTSTCTNVPSYFETWATCLYFPLFLLESVFSQFNGSLDRCHLEATQNMHTNTKRSLTAGLWWWSLFRQPTHPTGPTPRTRRARNRRDATFKP